MFWPDVRLKHFVEVRPADSLPEDCVLGYVALVKGIFYSEASLEAIEQALRVDPSVATTRGAWPIAEEDVDSAICQVQSHGFEGEVYGRSLRDWEELLFSLAAQALDDEEMPYLSPLRDFSRRKPWWEVVPREDA